MEGVADGVGEEGGGGEVEVVEERCVVGVEVEGVELEGGERC